MLRKIICLILCVSVVFMLTVVPATASTTVLVGGALVLASILVCLGIKLLPTSTHSVSDILGDLYRYIMNGGSTTSQFIQSCVDADVSAGDRITITAPLLQAAKSEITAALDISGIDEGSYTYGDVVLSPITITNTISGDVVYTQSILGSQMLRSNSDYIMNTHSQFNVGKTIEIDGVFYFNSGTNSHIKNLHMECELTSDNVAIGTIYRLRFNYTYDRYQNDVFYQEETSYIETDFIRDLSDLPTLQSNNYLTFIKSSGAPVNLYSGIEGTCNATDDRKAYIGNHHYVDGVNTSISGFASAIVIDADRTYDITITDPGTTTIETTESGAKTIVGAADAVIDHVAERPTGSISVTVPSQAEVVAGTGSSVSADVTDVIWNETGVVYDEVPALEYDTETGTEAEAEGGETGGGTSDEPDIKDLKLPEVITRKFPFSIPWDVYRIVHCLVAEPAPPSFVLPFNIGTFAREEIEIDLAQFEPLAVITRFFTNLLFIAGLIAGTRKLIGQ